MNILIFSDLHINKNELQECSIVLDEIRMLCNSFNVNTIIDLGDTFDTTKPTAKELDLFCNFLKKLNIPTIIISAQSHESVSLEESILNHFEILNNNIKVVKEYNDTNYMLCGHYTLKESNINYDAAKSLTELSQYRFVFLGHQHSFQVIKPNICHIGSCRYIDFAEVKDNKKVVCLIENYKQNNENVHFLSLKTPYSMKDIHLQKNVTKNVSNLPLEGTIFEDKAQIPFNAQTMKSEGENPPGTKVSVAEGIQILDKLDPKTKVRVIFHDFDSYAQFINKYDYYKNKFVLFKDKKEFLISDNPQFSLSTETKTLKESLQSYLEKAKVNDIIKNILLEEIK